MIDPTELQKALDAIDEEKAKPSLNAVFALFAHAPTLARAYIAACEMADLIAGVIEEVDEFETEWNREARTVLAAFRKAQEADQ